jgi:hypothetical protein
MRRAIESVPLGILGVAAVAACSARVLPPPGEVIVVVDTDMAVPKDVDEVEIEVLARGEPLLANRYGVGADALRLPATLGLLSGGDSTSVTVRAIGYQAGHARVLVEAVTIVPTDRVAMLRMPLSWLCDGQVKETNASDGTTHAASTCPDGATCRAGACVDATTSAADLPAFAPADVFGGGTGDGDGACFDAASCFTGSAKPATPDPATCTIDVPSGGAGPNVAVALDPGKAGFCDAGACYVVLAAESPFGWQTQAGRVALPQAVCGLVAKGDARVVVSTACPSRRASIPVCGPWSAAGQAIHAG